MILAMVRRLAMTQQTLAHSNVQCALGCERPLTCRSERPRLRKQQSSNSTERLARVRPLLDCRTEPRSKQGAKQTTRCTQFQLVTCLSNSRSVLEAASPHARTTLPWLEDPNAAKPKAGADATSLTRWPWHRVNTKGQGLRFVKGGTSRELSANMLACCVSQGRT